MERSYFYKVFQDETFLKSFDSLSGAESFALQKSDVVHNENDPTYYVDRYQVYDSNGAESKSEPWTVCTYYKGQKI